MLRAIETLANLWEFSDFRLVILLFVLPILLCNQRGRTGSLSLSLSKGLSFSLSPTFSLTWCSGARQIRNFEFRCRVCESLDQKQSGQGGLLGWVGGWCSRAQICRHFLLRDFRTGESGATRREKTRSANGETRREIYLAARLRLFGFLALTIIAPPQALAHVHTLYIYTDICIGFFFQSLDFDDILRGIQRFSNWLWNLKLNFMASQKHFKPF